MANTGRVSITATMKDEVSRKVNTMDTGFKNLNKTINVIKGAGFAVLATQALHYAGAAARAATETARLGAQLEFTTLVFERLTKKAGVDATQALGKLRLFTQGTIADLELMQRVGAALDAGLTFEQASTALRFLRGYSTAFGKDFNQLMATIFTGLQRGSVLMLDDAGIIISASDAMFKGLNDVEKKAALVGEAIRQMSKKIPELESSTSNAVIETDRLATAWSNFTTRIGQQFAPAVESASKKTADFLNMLTGISQEMEAQRTLKEAEERFKNVGQSVVVLEDRMVGFSEAITTARAESTLFTDDIVSDLKNVASSFQLAATAQDNLTVGIVGSATKATVAFEKIRKAVSRPGDEGLLATDADIDNLEEYTDLVKKLNAITMQMMRNPFAARLRWLAELQKAEIAASGERVDLLLFEVDSWEKAMKQRAILADGTEEEINRIMRTAQRQRDSIWEQERVRRVLVIFEGDASQVKSASDLAAFSLGQLFSKIGGLNSAFNDMVNVIGNLAAGNMLGAVAAGINILGQGIGKIFGIGGDSEQMRREMEKVAQTFDEVRDSAGAFAHELVDATAGQLQREYDTAFQAARRSMGPSGGTIFVDAATGIVDVARTMRNMSDSVGNINRRAAQNAMLTMNRVAEAIQNLGSASGVGSIKTFESAMDAFRHVVSLEGISDPGKKLELLRNVMQDIGVDIDQQNFQNLSLRNKRQITELIADLQREVSEAEIDTRMDYAKLLITAIKEQSKEVERALDDQLASQKQAALRSVRLSFDLQEMSLRSGFVSRFQGARNDPLEIAKLLAQAEREISDLQLAETAEANKLLADLNASIDAAKESAQASIDSTIAAIEKAAQDTSVNFASALLTELSALGVVLNEGFDITSIKSSDQISSTLSIKINDVAVAVGNQAANLGAIAGSFAPIQAQLSLANTYLNTIDASAAQTITQNERIIASINHPTWAAAVVGRGGFSGGSSSSGVTVNASIGTIQGGSVAGGVDYFKGAFEDVIEDLIIDSIRDGDIGSVLKQLEDARAISRGDFGKRALG